MDNVSCTALVPYVPKKQSPSAMDILYISRKSLYFLFLPLALASVFIGAYYFAFYARQNIGIAFMQSIFELSAFNFSTVLWFFFILVLSYTVFTPAAGILTVVPVAFSAGYFLCECFFQNGLSGNFLLLLLVESLYLFASFIYSAELAFRLSVTKQGFKYIISSKNNIPHIIKTALFILFVFLNNYTVNLL